MKPVNVAKDLLNECVKRQADSVCSVQAPICHQWEKDDHWQIIQNKAKIDLPVSIPWNTVQWPLKAQIWEKRRKADSSFPLFRDPSQALNDLEKVQCWRTAGHSAPFVARRDDAAHGPLFVFPLVRKCRDSQLLQCEAWTNLLSAETVLHVSGQLLCTSDKKKQGTLCNFLH